MRIPPTPLLRVQNAFRRGDLLTILAEGDAVAGVLAAEPEIPGDRSIDRWTAETALMLGIAHAAYERPAVAVSYLEHGLSSFDAATEPAAAGGATPVTGVRRLTGGRVGSTGRLAPSAPPAASTSFGRAADPSGGPAGTAPAGPFSLSGTPGGATGTPAMVPFMPPSAEAVVRSRRGSSLSDAAELLLLDLSLQLGRYDAAGGRLTALLEPSRPPAIRFAATRTQSAIAALRGDDETAHFLLNTATGLANRIPSRFRVALVEGDRAMILAGQGRVREAVVIADRLLGSFVRPLVGEYQIWSNTEGAAIALTASRACANAGDLLTAERLLQVGRTAGTPLGRGYLDAHVLLTRGVLLGASGDFDGAEEALLAATVTFNTYGYRPAAALTLLEQARLAHRRGLVRSARPLYERAIDELVDLTQPREARVARSLMAALDAGGPPTPVNLTTRQI